MMMNTCSNSRFHSAPEPVLTSKPTSVSLFASLFSPTSVVIVSPTCRRWPDRYRGFSLTEVMVALLLVMLGASAMISTMATARSRESSTAKFSEAFRMGVELSDWTRQGGLRALAAETENPFDLVDASGKEHDCFSNPCNAEDAALFYLYHWRRRLLLEVRDAHIVVCRGKAAARADKYVWACGQAEPGSHSRVIKIGWAQGGGVGVSGSRPRLILALT